jgi:hypothetical protein
MANFLHYKGQLNTLEQNFNNLVENFIQAYPNLVSAAAFNLGDLFDREEYPEAEAVRNKFAFNYWFTPVPTAGDFRVDVGDSALNELRDHYEKQFNDRVNKAMREAWDRLHECLTHVKDRLTDEVVNGEVKPKIFRDSLVENAMELTELLRHLNVTNDQKLEDARRQLNSALVGTNAKDLRDSRTTREDVRMQVEEILGKFDF